MATSPYMPFWTPDYRDMRSGYTIDIKADLPPVSVMRAEGGNGTLAVNENALRQFADVISRLAPHIDEAKRRLSMVDVKPGNFLDADNIVSKVGTQRSEGGLTRTYLEHLTNLRAAVTDVASRMRQLADKYSKAESANAITGEDVRALVEDMQTDFKVSGVTDAPNPNQSQIPVPAPDQAKPTQPPAQHPPQNPPGSGSGGSPPPKGHG